MARGVPWKMIAANVLADIMQIGDEEVLVIDSRSFLEYNSCHIVDSVNVCCSKLVKRRLQQGKVMVTELLSQACHHYKLVPRSRIIVYDQCTSDPLVLSPDCFLSVLLHKLVSVFFRIELLRGGFLEFQAAHPSLCDSKTPGGDSSSTGSKVPPLTSMSQPCMPVANVGPTKILPYLYLGSQKDALSMETVQQTGITHIVNVSNTCPRPTFISEGHFLRIPVNDNYADKLLPFFQEAFQFLDKVREANGCVLIHCLAGISRSPTLAIAYIMHHLGMSTDEAYKYVKDKRPTISPNFNFLGQLIEHEQRLRSQRDLSDCEASLLKKQCIDELRQPPTPVARLPRAIQALPKLKRFSLRPPLPLGVTATTLQSPTSALAKLNFNQPSPTRKDPIDNWQWSTGVATIIETSSPTIPLRQFPTTSLDKLSFVPCFTKEEHARRTASMSTQGSKSTSGTKRPLSMNVTDRSSRDHIASTSSTLTNFRFHPLPLDSFLCGQQVTLRSPETKAKRLVRPNSIAFSSYPLFDSDTAMTTQPQPQPQPQPCDQTSMEVTRDSASAVCTTAATTAGSQKPCVDGHGCGSPVNTQAALMRHSKSSNAIGALNNFEKGRKSRSLEDILNSPDDQYSVVECTAVRSHPPFRSHVAAEIFPPSLALDNNHCRGDPHQSSSSISSGGSRSSLHGSLELIQVS